MRLERSHDEPRRVHLEPRLLPRDVVRREGENAPASALATPSDCVAWFLSALAMISLAVPLPPGIFASATARFMRGLSLASAQSVIAPHCCTAVLRWYLRMTPKIAAGHRPSPPPRPP